MREKITGPGNEVGGGTPEEFAAFIAAETKRWAALVKAKGIKLD
jgi:tripartite-type tricarboxylate transporter receptor subunit TctC